MTNQVLVLNQFALPLSGGGGTRHVELFSRLENWQSDIIAANRHYLDQTLVSNEGILQTVPVTPFKGNGPSRVMNWASYSAAALAKGMFKRGIGAVYGSSPHLGAALAGLIIAKAHRVPFILEIRDLWPQILADSGMMPETSRVFKTLRSLEYFLYRSADRIVILAEGSRGPIEAAGIAGDRIVFIPNGADPSDFEPNGERSELRHKYGFSDFTAVYAGAHGPANGLDLVLDAAASLKGSGVSIALVGDGVSKKELMARAKREEITNVIFLDPVPKTEMANVLGAADVGLHSLADIELFKTGVSPNKLYDYMAAGLPVVTNTGGDTAALVELAESGLACAPDGMAEALAELASSDPAVLSAYGSAGIHYMKANRSRRAMAERLEGVLNEAAGR